MTDAALPQGLNQVNPLVTRVVVGVQAELEWTLLVDLSKRTLTQLIAGMGDPDHRCKMYK